jgi:hypothetical protein
VTDLDLRPRSASEIVDGAFALYRRNSAQYIVVTAIGHLPILLFQLLAPDLITPQTSVPTGGFLTSLLLLFAVSMVTYTLMSAIVIRLGSRYYLGEDADLVRTIREILPRVPALVIASIFKAVAYSVGFLLFIVGFVYMTARYFAVSAVVVIEAQSPDEAMRRSALLSRGRKGHILGTLGLVGVIYLVLSIGVSLLAGIAGTPIVTLVVSTLFTIVAYPVIALTELLLYYDARIRGEGFDVERMASSL